MKTHGDHSGWLRAHEVKVVGFCETHDDNSVPPVFTDEYGMFNPLGEPRQVEHFIVLDFQKIRLITKVGVMATGDKTHDPETINVYVAGSAEGPWTQCATLLGQQGSSALQELELVAQTRYLKLVFGPAFSGFQCWIWQVLFFESQPSMLETLKRNCLPVVKGAVETATSCMRQAIPKSVLSDLSAGHTDQVTSMDICDGNVVTGSFDKRVMLWDAETGKLLDFYEHADRVCEVGFARVAGRGRLCVVWAGAHDVTAAFVPGWETHVTYHPNYGAKFGTFIDASVKGMAIAGHMVATVYWDLVACTNLSTKQGEIWDVRHWCFLDEGGSQFYTAVAMSGGKLFLGTDHGLFLVATGPGQLVYNVQFRMAISSIRVRGLTVALSVETDGVMRYHLKDEDGVDFVQQRPANEPLEEANSVDIILAGAAEGVDEIAVSASDDGIVRLLADQEVKSMFIKHSATVTALCVDDKGVVYSGDAKGVWMRWAPVKGKEQPLQDTVPFLEIKPRGVTDVLPSFADFLLTPLQFMSSYVMLLKIVPGVREMIGDTTTAHVAATASHLVLFNFDIGHLGTAVCYLGAIMAFIFVSWTGMYEQANDVLVDMMLENGSDFSRRYATEMPFRKAVQQLQSKKSAAQMVIWGVSTVGFIPTLTFLLKQIHDSVDDANDAWLATLLVLLALFLPNAVAYGLQAGDVAVFTATKTSWARRVLGKLNPMHWESLRGRKQVPNEGFLTLHNRRHQSRFCMALLFAKMAAAGVHVFPASFPTYVILLQFVAGSLLLATQVLYPQYRSNRLYLRVSALYAATFFIVVGDVLVMFLGANSVVPIGVCIAVVVFLIFVAVMWMTRQQVLPHSEYMIINDD